MSRRLTASDAMDDVHTDVHGGHLVMVEADDGSIKTVYGERRGPADCRTWRRPPLTTPIRPTTRHPRARCLVLRQRI